MQKTKRVVPYVFMLLVVIFMMSTLSGCSSNDAPEQDGPAIIFEEVITERTLVEQFLEEERVEEIRISMDGDVITEISVRTRNGY